MLFEGLHTFNQKSITAPIFLCLFWETSSERSWNHFFQSRISRANICLNHSVPIHRKSILICFHVLKERKRATSSYQERAVLQRTNLVMRTSLWPTSQNEFGLRTKKRRTSLWVRSADFRNPSGSYRYNMLQKNHPQISLSEIGQCFWINMLSLARRGPPQCPSSHRFTGWEQRGTEWRWPPARPSGQTWRQTAHRADRSGC